MTATAWLLAALLSAPVWAAPVAAFASTSWNEEQTLLDLLRDRDPEVRRQAVRALKAWVPHRNNIRERVLDIFKNSSEDLAVRREAAKTLSVVSSNSDVSEALLEQGKRGGDDVGLRAVSYKSLYWAAVRRSDVRDELLDAARRESDQTVRLAAIWALFAVNDSSVKDVLRDIARRDDETVRVEALKSLYGLMGDSDVRDLAYSLARDSGTPAVVRRTAILLNSNHATSAQTDMLETIMKYDRDPAMRAAAIIALGNPRSEELQTHFHLIRTDQDGVLINDPLDAQ